MQTISARPAHRRRRPASLIKTEFATGLLKYRTQLGKRCTRLDLKARSGRQRFTDFLRQADVQVQGYRPTALAAVGLDEPTLHSIDAVRAPNDTDSVSLGHTSESAADGTRLCSAARAPRRRFASVAHTGQGVYSCRSVPIRIRSIRRSGMSHTSATSAYRPSDIQRAELATAMAIR